MYKNNNDGGQSLFSASPHDTRRGSVLLNILILGMGLFLAGVGILIAGQYSKKVQAQEVSTESLFELSNFERVFTVHVPSVFRELVAIAALEVEGESIFGGPVTFQGGSVFDGQITLQGGITGNGVNINLGDGKITASNVIYSLTAGSGISLSEGQTPTITNSDRGSSQSIFKKIKLGNDISEADSNDDVLEFSAGSGISLSLDTLNDKITITNSLVPGFVKSGTYAVLGSGITRMGVGTSNPGNTVEISSGTSGESGLTFTNLTSASSVDSGGGKVLSVDSGGKVILVTDESGGVSEGDLDSALPGGSTGSTIYFDGSTWAHTTNLYHNGGQVGISTIPGTNIRFDVKTNATTSVGLVIRRVASQTANLLELRNESDSILSYFDKDGVFNGQISGSGSFNPGFTTGSIVFQGASGLTQNNSNLFWDNTNNRLGIGTNNPASSLETSGALRVSGTESITDTKYGSSYEYQIFLARTLNADVSAQTGLLLGTGSYGNNPAIRFKGSATLAYVGARPNTDKFEISTYGVKPLAFATNSIDRLTITGAGDIGIGTTSPNGQLEIQGASGTNTLIIRSTGGLISESSGIQFQNSSGVSARAFVGWDGTYQGLKIATADSGKPIIFSNSTTAGSGEVMRITGDGNVGVGSNSPASNLHVHGGYGGNALAIFNQVNSGDLLTASASGTTRFVVKNDGKVGIGTTTPSHMVDISGSLSGMISARIRNTSTSGAADSRLVFSNSGGNEAFLIYNGTGNTQFGGANSLNFYQNSNSASMTFSTYGTERMRITNFGHVGIGINGSNGNLGLGTTTFGTNAARTLAISGSTAPTTAITDGVQLFAVDVSGSHELRVMDEAGNTTTLSPHNFSIIGNQSEEMAWSFYSERNSLAINADMAKAMRLVERLSGEKIIYLKDLKTGLSLEDDSDATHTTELAQNGFISNIAKWNYKAWTFLSDVFFEKPVTFLASLRAHGTVWFGGRVTYADRDHAGIALIPVNGKTVHVQYEEEYVSLPILSVTPVDWSGNFTVKQANKSGFIIELSEITQVERVFHWTATSVENTRTVRGEVLSTPVPSKESSTENVSTSSASQSENLETSLEATDSTQVNTNSATSSGTL